MFAAQVHRMFEPGVQILLLSCDSATRSCNLPYLTAVLAPLNNYPALPPQCFRASDIVLYISTMLEGGVRYTARELAQYARERGVFFAQDMYRHGFACTARMERVTAVTYTWVSGQCSGYGVRCVCVWCEAQCRRDLKSL